MNTKLNKSDYHLLILYFMVALAINIYTYYKNGSSFYEYVFDIPTYVFSTTVIIVLLVNWLIPVFFIKRQQFMLFFIITCLILIFFGTIEFIINSWSAGNTWYKEHHILDIFLRRSIVMASEQTAFPFALILTKKFYEGQSQYLKIEKQQKENELKLLRSQINPHFLFNNLNTLDSLIDSDSEKAKEYINRLSLIYRYLIQTKDAEVMELSKEITFAENYIFLTETRFGKDYTFSIKKEVEVTDKFIPTGALQALLENVVKHNKAKKNPIETTIFLNDDWLTVKNTKTINLKKESLGTGLQNLQTRYELLSDKKVRIKNTDNYFEIAIPIIKLSKEN